MLCDHDEILDMITLSIFMAAFTAFVFWMGRRSVLEELVPVSIGELRARARELENESPRETKRHSGASEVVNE